jgi:hypothetical protein
MVMAYDLRDSKGQLVMTVSNTIAQHIIQQAPGIFGPWKCKPEVTVFEIRQDMTTTMPGAKFYLWAGSLLIPRSQ